MHLEQHLPAVQATSARLQIALEVYNASEWPVPPPPGSRLEQIFARKPGGRVDENGEILRGALHGCREFGVERTRWSGEGGLLDGRMRRWVAEREGEGGVYGYVFDAEKMEIVRKEGGKLEEKMGVKEGVKMKEIGVEEKGKEVERADASGVAVAESSALGVSPLDISKVPSHDDTGTTVILTPQPAQASTRIVEVTDDASTGCSEYLAPGEDSPLFPQDRMSMTENDVAMMIEATHTIDPEKERRGAIARSSCGGMVADNAGLDSSPETNIPRSVSSTEDSPHGEGSSSGALNWIGAGEPETASMTEDGIAASNMDTTMGDVNQNTEDYPIVPGISVTTPGDSSTAIQGSTAQLRKSQKKNQARKQKGYKKPKPKNQKTDHLPTAATTTTTSTSPRASSSPPRPFDLRDRSTHPPFTLTPTPALMPGTFTNSICHHPTLLAHPILTLTFATTTPSFSDPATLRNHIITHFEVGLDGVEAIAQGQVSIAESTAWKAGVREARVGKIGLRKEGLGGFDAGLCARQLAAGYGRGMWIFFAIRWRRTVHDCREGRGGKWVCFGAPVEAVRRRRVGREPVNLNHFVEGASERLAMFRRMEVRFAAGGVPCFDLLYGAERNWNEGVWEKVKSAMATGGCVVSFLGEEDEEGARVERRRYWGIMEKPDVEPFFSEGQTEGVSGLLPGFRAQGDRGLGLAEQGDSGGGAAAGKGKGKAATVEDANGEDVLGGGGENEGVEEECSAEATVEGKAETRPASANEMPPPPSPMKWAIPQATNSEWQAAKRALEESHKKWRAEVEVEALCARLEKEGLEQYEKGLKAGRLE